MFWFKMTPSFRNISFNILFKTMQTNFKYTADIDECNSGTSPCNSTSENCVNNIGSYRCECKVGFVKQSAPCEGSLHFCLTCIKTQKAFYYIAYSHIVGFMRSTNLVYVMNYCKMLERIFIDFRISYLQTNSSYIVHVCP